jgi:membrane dipeptidase
VTGHRRGRGLRLLTEEVNVRRRTFIAGGLALSLAPPTPVAAQVVPPVPIGDMHFHSFFGDSRYHARPVASTLAEGGATLVAWKAVGDLLWVDWQRYKQKAEPKAGEAIGWLAREIGRIKAHCAEQRLRIIEGPADVERALKGEPHIVLAVEGATFIDGDIGAVERAFDLGIRHLQLVHFMRNPLADIQTLAPGHGGLTDLGKAVVRECNRLGMLVDLAHATPAAVNAALAISSVPVVWSHGSVTRGPTPHPGLIIWRARQLPLATAKAISQKGGVVGLWGLTLDVGRTPVAYADRMVELAQWLGEDHVAFGTDINGLGPNAVFGGYAEVRLVVEHWQRQRMNEQRVRKLAIDNYARVLQQALAARRA